jgi:SNF2 family DNA or RNA helicase
MKYRPKRPMRIYQAQGLKKLLSMPHKSGMVWFEPGLGKTKLAIDYMNVMFLNEGLRKILVLGTISAIGVWDEEVPKDVLDEIPYNIMPVYETSNPLRVKQIQAFRKNLDKDKLNILVMNHDCVRNDEVWSELFAFAPELLIIDEIQYFKEVKTIRWRKLWGIRRNSCRYRIGLTGTPVKKNPLDLFGQFKLINENILGENYYQFRGQYAIMDYMFPNKVKKFINQDHLSRRVAPYQVRATDSSHLPKLIEQDIPVPMSAKTLKYYDQMAKELVVEIEGNEVEASMAAIKYMKLHQITGGFLMNKTAQFDKNGDIKDVTECFAIANDKLKILKDLIEQNDGHQFIVGCRFTYEVHICAETISQMGLKVGVIEGGVSGKKRDLIKQSFQNHELDVVVFQIQAANAQTLTMGDIGILYSSNGIWSDYYQWLKRIHREGSTKSVVIYRLVCRGTVDETITKRLAVGKDFTFNIADKYGMLKAIRGG